VSELAFDFGKMIREIRMFGSIAEGFLDDDGAYVLDRYVRQLELIRGSKLRNPTRWTIGTERPLKTRMSEGGYESPCKSISISIVLRPPRSRCSRRTTKVLSLYWLYGKLTSETPPRRVVIFTFRYSGMTRRCHFPKASQCPGSQVC
jgi:hypothetical protein